MKPTYFPFTFISKPVADALSTCFKKTIVYQASKRNIPVKMREWDKSGHLEIRTPIEGDEEKLEKILEEYKAWVILHQGGELSFLKTQSDNIPFFEEYSTSQIAADMKKGHHKQQRLDKPDVSFNARLFLQIAQEYDLQKDVLSQDLLLFEELEQNLIKDLKGENESSYTKTDKNREFETHDPGNYMVKERIQAWIYMMQHDRQPSGLFVTSSRSVIEHIMDNMPEGEVLLYLHDISIPGNWLQKKEKWHNDLMEYLEILATSSYPISTDIRLETPSFFGQERKISLTFYIVPGISPKEFFAGDIELAPSHPSEKQFKNTLIGLLQI
jgi:hypothetical protein